MPFAALDDQFHSNPKVIAAGLDGAGLYARALSYCADKLTDGYVPSSWSSEIARKPIRNKITTAQLWIEVAGGETFVYESDGAAYTVIIPGPGYFIVDYLEYNPTRESALAKRDELSRKRAEAGRKGAAARWQRQRQTDSNAIATAWQTNGPPPHTPNPSPLEQGSSVSETTPSQEPLASYEANGRDENFIDWPVFGRLHLAVGPTDENLTKLRRAAKGVPEAGIVAALESCQGPNVNDPLAVALSELKKRKP